MAAAEPLQAVVEDATSDVVSVIVCDQETADLFATFDPPVFPGATLHDVTGLGVGIGWTWVAGRTPEFRPPQPSADSTWNDETASWDVPEPPTEETPTPSAEPG